MVYAAEVRFLGLLLDKAFTFNGHNFLDGAETVVSKTAGGGSVFQMFVNYQNGISGEITGAGSQVQGPSGAAAVARDSEPSWDSNIFQVSSNLVTVGKPKSSDTTTAGSVLTVQLMPSGDEA